MLKAGLAIFPDQRHSAAIYPLIRQGVVDAIEWTIDLSASKNLLWLAALKGIYGLTGNLLGHGVHYPILSLLEDSRYDAWLTLFKRETSAYRYRHHTVHFGYSTAWNVATTTPLPFIMEPLVLDHATRRLDALAQISGRPIGVENLGFGFSYDDIRMQADMLERMLHPTNGILLLDLHNIYCQAVNMHVDPLDIVAWHPLDRVREIHISGGSAGNYVASDGAITPIRADTHDSAVPEDVFALLQQVMPRCQNLTHVILEHLPRGLTDDAETQRLHDDYKRLFGLVEGMNV